MESLRTLFYIIAGCIFVFIWLLGGMTFFQMLALLFLLNIERIVEEIRKQKNK